MSAPAILAWCIMALSAFLHPCFHDGLHPCGAVIARTAAADAECAYQAAAGDSGPCCEVPCPVCHVLFAVSAGETIAGPSEVHPAAAVPADSGRPVRHALAWHPLRGPPALA